MTYEPTFILRRILDLATIIRKAPRTSPAIIDSSGNPGIGVDSVGSVDEESVDVTTIVVIAVLLRNTTDVVVVGDCVVRVAVEKTVAVCVDVLGLNVDI